LVHNGGPTKRWSHSCSYFINVLRGLIPLSGGPAMKTHVCFLVLVFGAVLAASLAFAGDGGIQYPPTQRGDVVDDYHGTKVPDPYRWLEEDVRKSKQVAEWVAAENKATNAYLRDIPERESIQRRLTELWNYERYTVPFKAGGRYFYSKNDGLQNQSVLYTQD